MLREHLGVALFDEAYARGTVLSLEDAMDLVLTAPAEAAQGPAGLRGPRQERFMNPRVLVATGAWVRRKPGLNPRPSTR
jgi:hypothetical protein